MGPKILMASDIHGALDSAFAVVQAIILAQSALVASSTTAFGTVLSLQM